MSNICPICQKDDNIQKVTAIISGGTHTGSSTGLTTGGGFVDGKFVPAGGITTQNVSLTSNLARRLMSAFPKAPRKNGACSTIVVYFFCAVFILGGGYFTPLLIIGAVNNTINARWTIGDFLAFWVLLAMGVGAVVLGIFLIKMYRAETKKGQAKYIQEMETHRNRLAKYDELYYCYRDDVVFIPGMHTSAPPENMLSIME